MDNFLLAFLPDLDVVLNILKVAVGLGLVIFFHELGHFAVAKWCDVNVERFSIGFGPILLSRKWGETEYALSAVPFGGYVKMLGQDDSDPSQLTSEEIAEDPRSYTAKTVPQRMAIISAGVTMNIITGLMFFVIAFLWGVHRLDSEIGAVKPGSPAWENGIRPGDRLIEIDGSPINGFEDIMRAVALSHGAIDVRGVHADGSKYSVTLSPMKPDGDKKTRRQIGVGFPMSLEIPAEQKDADSAAIVPGSPAALAADGFQPGDRIRQVGDETVESFSQLEAYLAEHRSEPVDVYVKRRGEGQELVKVTIPPRKYRVLGLQMDIGKIDAVRPGSPAHQAGIKKGDKLTAINGQKIGDDLDPMRLPEILSELSGEEVTISVSREGQGQGRAPETIDFSLTPESFDDWIEYPELSGWPLSITSIGVAYHVIPTVFRVDPNGPAADLDVSALDTIEEVALNQRDDVPDAFRLPESSLEFPIGEDNWAFAFWTMQDPRIESVTLKLKSGSDTEPKQVQVMLAEAADDWFLPNDRGLKTQFKRIDLKADSVGDAVTLGWLHTTNSIKDIYLTLRGLVSGDISFKELHGPIGIAEMAYAQADVKLSQFILFLGLISVNLAVINFLPIPVLDGGHMVFLIWEALTRRKPNEQVVVAATYCGLAFVLGLMVFVIYIDLFVH